MPKNALYIYLFFVFNWNIVYSQINLVPNGDFELFDSCNVISYIDNAHAWFSPYTPMASAEYFNSCNPYPSNSPNNYLGYQYPISGLGYAGVDVYSDGVDNREYISVPLLDTLHSGLTYCVRFHISLADYYNKGADGIGIYFSQDSIYYSSPSFGVLNLPAQIQNPSGNIITDTINWTLIEGQFVAAGGERYLTIGNFKNDANTQTITQGMSPYSYFYIDDVSVTEGSCNVGIDEKLDSFSISISPNPVIDQFQITVPEKNFSNLKYQVYAVDGRRIQDGALQRSTVSVQCSEWESGLYLIQIFDNDGHSSTVKVLKL